MEMTWMDIVYFVFIAAVLIGGITAIVILCPKENKLRQEKDNCYRCFQKGGKLVLSNSLPSLFEKWFGKPLYIEKGPFDIELFFDSVKGADDKSYRTGAILQLYLPESGAQTAAEYLYSVLSDFNQDAICEMLKAELEPILKNLVTKYKEGADIKALTEELRLAAINKLSVFGYDLYCPPTLKIALN